METLKNSWLYALYLMLTGWVRRQWQGSALLRYLTGQVACESPALSRLLKQVRKGWCAVFEKLRLPKLLGGSIFLHPEFYAAAAVVLLPLVPTMGILGLVGAGFFSLVLKLGTDRDFTLKKSPINIYVGLFGCIYLFCTLTSLTPGGSLFPGMLTTVFLLFFFVLTACGFSRRGIDRLLVGMTAAGLVVACYGFYQFLFPEQFRNVWTDTDMFSNLTFRVYSTLENPNVLGEYFLLVVPLGGAVALTREGWKGKLLGLLALAAMGVCLVLTYSRGCYLGLLFAMAVFVVLLQPKLLIPGVVLLLLCPLYLPESVLTRFTSIGNMGDTSTSYRVYIWMGTLAMLKDHWFSGIGPGEAAFDLVYPDYAYNAVTAPHSHSLYLQLLCDLGVVGLLVFLGLLLAFYRMMFTAIRREQEKKAKVFQIAGVSAVTGFLVQGATDYTFYNYRVMLLFWVLLALCVCFTRMTKSSGTGEENHDEDTACAH